MEAISSMRGIFEDPPELFLIKGGRWNQASTFINIFLGLVSSTILIIQQSEPIVVCLNSANNRTSNLGSNYAYAEEECEGQMLEDFPASMFHKYIGWVFTVQIILMVMWGRIWIGGNRILIERCTAFGQLMESFTNVTGHMTEEERKNLWINQDYLQRSNKMLFAEMRTKDEIKKSRRAKLAGNIVLSSLFSIFNICILHFTNNNHEDVVKCELASDANLTCQFTAFDFVSILAAIFTGIFILELLFLILEAFEFYQQNFKWVKSLYEAEISESNHTNIDNIVEDSEGIPVTMYRNATYEAKGESEDEGIARKNKIFNGDIKPMSNNANQASIPYDDSCDLFYLVDALCEIHGTAMTFLFLSIIDEKVKLRWEYGKVITESLNSITICRKDATFYNMARETLEHFRLAPQIIYKVNEVRNEKVEHDWKMVQKPGSSLDGIDWEHDPIKIPLVNYLGPPVGFCAPPHVKLNVVVVWNKRQIWEGDFIFGGSPNNDDGMVAVPQYMKAETIMKATPLRPSTIAKDNEPLIKRDEHNENYTEGMVPQYFGGTSMKDEQSQNSNLPFGESKYVELVSTERDVPKYRKREKKENYTEGMVPKYMIATSDMKATPIETPTFAKDNEPLIKRDEHEMTKINLVKKEKNHIADNSDIA